MTYSPHVDDIIPPTTRKWQERPADVQINGVIVHHHGTTTLAGFDRLTTSTDPASANIIILNDGKVIGSVAEQYRAWTTSSYDADDDKITIEVQNSTGGPRWEISDAAMASLIMIYADIAHRYDFPPDRAHIEGHRDYVATLCPGDYIYSRLGMIADAATEQLNQLGDGAMLNKILWHAGRILWNVRINNKRLWRIEKIARENRDTLNEIRDTLAVIADPEPEEGDQA